MANCCCGNARRVAWVAAQVIAIVRRLGCDELLPTTHLPMLVSVAILCSWCAPLLQVPIGRAGLWSLTQSQLSGFWLRLDSMPIVPWLGLHNTIVHGSTLVWMVACVPLYVSCWILTRMLMGDEIREQAERIATRVELSSRVRKELDAITEIRPIAAKMDAGSEQSPIAPPHVVWDSLQAAQEAALVHRFHRSKSASSRSAAAASDRPESEKSVAGMPEAGMSVAGMPETSMPLREANSADEIAQRAAEIAAWAEELVDDELAMDRKSTASEHRTSEDALSKQSGTTTSDVTDEDRWLIETTMEVVRIAEQAVAAQTVQKSKIADDRNDLSSDRASRPEDDAESNVAARVNERSKRDSLMPASGSITTELDSMQNADSQIRREQAPHSDHHTHLETNRSGVASGAVNRPREEALHYLLRHLKGIQEKAKNP